MFLGALLLVAYGLGDATDGATRLWSAATTTFVGMWRSLRTPAVELDGGFVDVLAGDAAAGRVQLLAPTLAGSVLIAGGRHRFMDRCPGFVGCLAVEYDRHGRFSHAFPFRPEAYEDAVVDDGLAQPVGYERTVGFDFAKHADVFSVASYSNGDLAVVLHTELSLPPALGIARVDRDGRPRWFRADGSHHWAAVAHGRLRGIGAGLRDAVVVPSRRMGAGWPPGSRELMSNEKLAQSKCGVHFIDYLHVIRGDGVLLREFDIAAALRDSPSAPVLAYSRNPCDPLHLNSVAVLRQDGPNGLAAGDFLVSLRGLSALAAYDGADGHLKRIWRGSFYGQHGAREFAGPTGAAFLLFDNWGREGAFGPGRLLALDPRSGGERTIYPNASSPAAVRLDSQTQGGVSIAPDDSRAIVHAYDSGQAVEVDLATSEATAVFRQLEDVSALAAAGSDRDHAFRWRMRDIRYVAGPASAAAP